VCAYKPNSAFYESYGADGIDQLRLSCAYIQEKYPNIPIVLDFKRGDIGNTNQHYAKFAFEYLGVDAITVQPYLGKEAMQAFLDYKDKGLFILCRTSNSGSGEFQDLQIGDKKLYQVVAEHVAKEWNDNLNCHLVLGATYPRELADIRSRVGDEVVFLVPGIGAQGGDMQATLSAGLNSKKAGLLISSSREILYASNEDNFAEAARIKAQDTYERINSFRV
jgi:orotidine-5'-phosphate decarboxylase